MTVTLTTKEGFGGKLYAYNNLRGCQSRGLGRTETSLRFFYEEDEASVPRREQCGVKTEEKGIFSNTVVIQNHPVIQQKGDRAIKLYCYFETGEKTVTNSYNVLADTIPELPPFEVNIVIFGTSIHVINFLNKVMYFVPNRHLIFISFKGGTSTTGNTNIYCQWYSTNTFCCIENYRC